MNKIFKNSKKEKKATQELSPSHQSSVKIFLKNIILLIGSILLLFILKNYNDGYKWEYNDLLKANLIFMKMGSEMTDIQKGEYKMGFSWKYMNFVAEKTPQTAIIRIPPDSAFFPKGKKSDFKQYILLKEWASYFVYPRKLVYEREKYTSQLYNQATYQAIVNYWGYHKLPYKINGEAPYTILPLQKK